VETLTFYSYKGGVGRSLLLAKAALFLASRGKRVVALDFDFEAPGLHYKFDVASEAVATGGVVPYLVATAEGSSSPPSFDKHMIPLGFPRSRAAGFD
jgi:Mrp family chromosome partitioning ATPase